MTDQNPYLQATFDCLLKTYGFLTPDFWKETRFTKSPYQEYTDLLAKPTAKTVQIVDDVEAWWMRLNDVFYDRLLVQILSLILMDF